jgi:murein DD-endopeptidase MepM/ murein hydrolase activator NlpD
LNPFPQKIAKQKKILFLLLLLLAGGLAVWGTLRFFSPEPSEKPQAVVTPESPPPPAPPPEETRVISGKISKGQSLSAALRPAGIPAEMIESISRHLKPILNLRRMNPGDSYEVRLTPEGKFRGFSYQSSPIDVYQITLKPSGEWNAQKLDLPVDKYWAQVSGEITSSLFETMNKLGERDQLTLDFADIFAWEIDFRTELQPGDRFRIVVEKYYAGGSFVKYGRILFVEFKGQAKSLQGIYYGPGKGPADYFTEKGESLRKAFLRSPLKFTRISSGYSKSRLHPILGENRPHLGVDYAAPVGTPVWAVADGTVATAGWNGGYGKQVVLKHVKGYQSLYGHLSRIAPGLQKGKAVRQKQLIGYVGSTGLSTGPHLDFRLTRSGVYRNPLKEFSPRAPSLTSKELPDFQQAVAPLLQWARDPEQPKLKKEATISSHNLKN